MSAATDDAPVVVSFPTIMNGLVLRWYPSVEAYAAREEIVSASREGIIFRCPRPEVSTDLMIAVRAAQERIRAAYHMPFGSVDEEKYAEARALATHRATHIFGDDLVALPKL